MNQEVALIFLVLTDIAFKCNSLTCTRIDNEDFSYKTLERDHIDCLTCIKFRTENTPMVMFNCDAEVTEFGEIVCPGYSYPQGITVRDSHFGTLTNEERGKSCRELWLLEISNCNVKNISDQFFYQYSELRTLNLSNNEISTMKNDVFSPLTRLQKMSLSRNNITNIHVDLFKPLSDLFEIDLSYNKIKHVPVDLFKNQLHLEVVNFKNNEIVAFQLVFWNSPRFVLQSVDLSWNKIENISINRKINILNLSHNQLVEFSLNLSSSLQELYLSFNKIKKIGENTFLNSFDLSHLDLSSNLLESLPTGSFTFQKSLRYFNISNNLFHGSKYGSENNWVSFFLHCKNLQIVSLENNMWDCEDLKDIMHTLNHQPNIEISAGTEHTKSNVFGISCIRSNITNNETEYLSNPNSNNIVDLIVEKVLTHLKTTSQSNDNASNNIMMKIKELENKMFSKVNDLENKVGNLTIQAQNNFSNLADQQKLEGKQMFSTLLNDLQGRAKQTTPGNTSILKESKSAEEILNRLSLLLDSKLSDLKKNEKEDAEKTDKILENISAGANAVSGEIIHNVLLFSMLCMIIYVLFVVLRRSRIVSREVIDLVST